MKIDLKNKIILVTGSTSGIGRQIAKQLLENGATVIITYGHNKEMAEETREELKKYEKNIFMIKAELAQENEVDNMFNRIKEKYNHLDGLVNCAAYDKIVSIEKLTIEDYRYEINVNLIARWQCIKNAIPLMKMR